MSNHLIVREKFLSKLASGIPTRGTLEQFARACDTDPMTLDQAVTGLMQDDLISFLGSSMFEPEAVVFQLKPVLTFEHLPVPRLAA